MEIESKNGSKIRLQEGSENIDFGRGLGFNSTDLTVSRRHISFKLHQDPTRVCFQVKGKNPLWVHDSRNDEIRVYKRSEGGEMKSGDSFCVSSKNPVWFNLKRIACEDEDDNESKSDLRYDDAFAGTSGTDYVEIETGDIYHIDPVKEFNFVVMGHEFDCYPKKMIRDMRNWDWFLEEPKEDSEEDEVSERKAKKGIRRKRKKGGGKDDEDDDVWTGGSEEDDAETIKKLRNIPKPRYSTRSENPQKTIKDMAAIASKSAKDATKRCAMDDEDEDDDDTLGGFIVDDEDIGEGGNNEDDEEEEEFEEDEYDDE